VPHSVPSNGPASIQFRALIRSSKWARICLAARKKRQELAARDKGQSKGRPKGNNGPLDNLCCLLLTLAPDLRITLGLLFANCLL